jgi:hypothetical protein
MERARKNFIKPCSVFRHHAQGTTLGFGIGEGADAWHIAFNGAANNPDSVSRIDHACFTIEDFDAERVMPS